MNSVKKYILYSTDRVGKDFKYIFDELLDIDYEISSQNQLRAAHPWPIILAGFDKTEAVEILKESEKKKGIDYFFEEDFFENLDESHIPHNKELIIWGTGHAATDLMNWELSLHDRIKCFIDSKPRAESFFDIPIIQPQEITDWNSCYVIIAVIKDDEIKEFLCNKGLEERKDFITFGGYVGRPSSLLRKTIFDRNKFEVNCKTMLNHLEILAGGNTCCCCTTFLRESLGNVLEKDKSKIWNGIRHRILCLSTENQTFSFCDKTMCPLFVGKTHQSVIKESEFNQENDKPYAHMEESPKVLVLGHDVTCNLYCSTCREKPIVLEEEKRNEVDRITELIKKQYLSSISFLVLAGNGEVFASRAYRDIYLAEQCNDIKYMRLLTNGMMFNKKNWDALIKNKKCKVMMTVSIDAATKETYEKIRRGGNFDILSENMRFASTLRKTGQLSYFRLNFVVQRENYREMPLFVRWAEELGCDEAFFTKILNWGTYTDDEFRKVSMMQDDMITPKPELMEIMNDPYMRSPIVDMGTIQALHITDDTDAVYNYYMWELEKRGGRLFRI